MVVYAVWDRVARVRFPAPRQNEKQPFLRAVFHFVGENKQNNLLVAGNRTPERCFADTGRQNREACPAALMSMSELVTAGRFPTLTRLPDPDQDEDT